MTDENEQISESAGTEKPDQQQRSPIPYDRFSEVVQQRNARDAKIGELESRLAEYEAAETERKRKKLEDEGRQNEIIAELEPKAKRVEELESALQRTLNTEIEQLPERWRNAVPKQLSAIDQLDWIRDRKAEGLFDLPKAPPMDAGVTGDSIEPAVKASAEDIEWARTLHMPIERYMANKAAGQKFRGET